MTITAGGSVYFSTSATAAEYSWVFPGGSPATSTVQTPGERNLHHAGDLRRVADGDRRERQFGSQPADADDHGAAADRRLLHRGEPAVAGGHTRPVDDVHGDGHARSAGSPDGEPQRRAARPGFRPASRSGGFSPPSITRLRHLDPHHEHDDQRQSVGALAHDHRHGGPLTHTASTTLLVNLAPPASLTRDAGQRAGRAVVAGVGRGDELSREARHRERRAVRDGGLHHRDQLHRHGPQQRHDVLLRRLGEPSAAGPNAGGESADSTEASATPLASAAGGAPGVKASSGHPKGDVKLRWTQSTTPGVTQNYIYRRTGTDSSYPSTPTVKISAANSYLDTKLTSGARYCYVVTAVNCGGEGAKIHGELRQRKIGH